MKVPPQDQLWSWPAEQAEITCACEGKAVFVSSTAAGLQMQVESFYKAHEGHEDTSPRPPGWDREKERNGLWQDGTPI